MKEVEPSPFMALADEVMSYKGLSAYLKLSHNTLRHKVSSGTIPFFKIDGAVRFSKKKIDAWIEEKHKGAKSKEQRTENKEQGDMSKGELFTDDEGMSNGGGFGV